MASCAQHKRWLAEISGEPIEQEEQNVELPIRWDF